MSQNNKTSSTKREKTEKVQKAPPAKEKSKGEWKKEIAYPSSIDTPICRIIRAKDGRVRDLPLKPLGGEFVETVLGGPAHDLSVYGSNDRILLVLRDGDGDESLEVNAAASAFMQRTIRGDVILCTQNFYQEY